MSMFPRPKQFAQPTLLRVHRKQPALLAGGTAKAAGASSCSPLSGLEGAFPERPGAVVNTSTFGRAETSVASFATSFQIHMANETLRAAGTELAPLRGHLHPSLGGHHSGVRLGGFLELRDVLAARGQLLVFHRCCPHVRSYNAHQQQRVRTRRSGKRKTTMGSTWRSRAWNCGGGTRTAATRATTANLDHQEPRVQPARHDLRRLHLGARDPCQARLLPRPRGAQQVALPAHYGRVPSNGGLQHRAGNA
jgi:hypothetical protein